MTDCESFHIKVSSTVNARKHLFCSDERAQICSGVTPTRCGDYLAFMVAE